MKKRSMSVAGAFYPSGCDECMEMFKEFNLMLEKSLNGDELPAISPKAVIVPHAGYVYSGFTANIAYRVLQNNRNFKRAIVIGPSHRVYFDGISGSFFDFYETPCGDFEIDTEYLEKLSSVFPVSFYEHAHLEHSTEVQFPFLKYYFPDIKVIEFVYANEDPVRLSKMVRYLLEDKDNVVVISTDLSHYYDQKRANILDSICINAVYALDPLKLKEGCEACGIIGMEALIRAAKELDLTPQILNYQTSGDITGDTSSVVGYMSAAIF